MGNFFQRNNRQNIKKNRTILSLSNNQKSEGLANLIRRSFFFHNYYILEIFCFLFFFIFFCLLAGYITVALDQRLSFVLFQREKIHFHIFAFVSDEEPMRVFGRRKINSVILPV